MRNQSENIFVVLTGLTAGGKSTQKDRLAEEYRPTVTFTTRPLRKNERAGWDYIPISVDDFNMMETNGRLTAVNPSYGKFRYGTNIEDVARARSINATWVLNIRAAADVDNIIRKDLPDIADGIIQRMIVVMVGPGPEGRKVLEERYVKRERVNGKPEGEIREDFRTRFFEDQRAFPALLARMAENPRMFRRLPLGTIEEETASLMAMIEEQRVLIRREVCQGCLVM